ncbi:hypothetical protein ACWC5F_21060 [Streptomyces sp. NPDC001272]|uniref:hypothetical protein n=1 Tax=Streptomyces sp. NPDC001674 TaxID=3154394 RepID=UPI00332DB697
MSLAVLPPPPRWRGALARRRQPLAWRASLAEVGRVHGTGPFVWITMMPGAGAGIVPGRLSLVPGIPALGGSSVPVDTAQYVLTLDRLSVTVLA